MDNDGGITFALDDSALLDQDPLILAEALIRGGKLDAAEKSINEMLSHKPNNWRFKEEKHDSVWCHFWNRQEFLDFVNYYKDRLDKSIFWAPVSYPKAYCLLSYIYSEQRDFQKALQQINKGLLLEPDNPKLLSEKAYIYGKRGDDETALRFYDLALTARPWISNQVRVRCLRDKVMTLSNLNRVDEAKNILLQLKDENPTDQTLVEDLAVEALRRAPEIDPDDEEAINSLALTQMKQGDFEYALRNYDAALKVMARRIVRGLHNSPKRGIIKHHDFPDVLWMEYALSGATFLAASDETVSKLAFPTGETAVKEERDENHEGLYWIDKLDGEGSKVRYFLPNFFNSFRDSLSRDDIFPILLRGKGNALQSLGRVVEAQQHFDEAEQFRMRD